jgi:hypothetical protein
MNTKLALALILTVALFAGSGMALAQQAPTTPPGQQHQMGPGMMMGPMMCCSMTQMNPEQMKQMQQWWQACPMWQMTPQQAPAQPQPKK